MHSDSREALEKMAKMIDFKVITEGEYTVKTKELPNGNTYEALFTIGEGEQVWINEMKEMDLLQVIKLDKDGKLGQTTEHVFRAFIPKSGT